MKILCPDTGNEIPYEDINVAKDLAYSKYTGTMHTLSELVGGSPSTVDHDEKIIGNPTKG